MTADAVQPAIAVLKPDAHARGLAPAVMAMLHDGGFIEEARRDVRFTPAEVGPLLLHPVPANVAHLTSGPASVHLLRGPGGPHGLYALKHRVREAFGTPDRVRNLIHGADEGTEHHLQLAAFFPDLPVERHCCLADPDLRFAADDPDEARRRLDRLDRDSSLGALVVTLRPDQRRLVALRRYRPTRLRLSFAALLTVANGAGSWTVQVHAANDDPAAPLAPLGDATPPDLDRMAEHGHALTLVDLAVPPREIARYRHALRTHGPDVDDVVADLPSMRVVSDFARRGVGGLQALLPGMPLIEAELRSDLARLAGLRITGGSAGRAAAGAFSLTPAALPTLPAR